MVTKSDISFVIVNSYDRFHKLMKTWLFHISTGGARSGNEFRNYDKLKCKINRDSVLHCLYVCSFVVPYATLRLAALFWQWQWQWQWINFIAMHYIKNTEFHAESFIIIGTIWDIVHQSHTWQKGLEAKAYVPQYLLYNVTWKGARKKNNGAGSALCYTLLPCNK